MGLRLVVLYRFSAEAPGFRRYRVLRDSSLSESIVFVLCFSMSMGTGDPSYDELHRLRSARTFVIAARTNRNLNIASIVLPIIGVVAGASQLPDPLVFTLNLVGVSFLVRWIVRSVEALSTSTGRLFGELLKGTLGHSLELLVES